MSLHIIVDGYNLIRQSPELAHLDKMDLELGRDALIEQLAAYKRIRPNRRITVVFDGTSASIQGQRQHQKSGIHIVFSRPGELADGVIKRMASGERERAVIISSDRDILQHAEAAGCAVLNAEDFVFRMQVASRHEDGVDAPEEEGPGGWVPGTRKKGPSRKPPRKQRKTRLRIDKL
ncbi:NYN domain-containing protein [Desulfatirhabdium butyrativorans]|uniref:NYN domain-containing protein n=1 Tax=Desulfatirhabdium butyrativorans TaxID=340467 RepID=UPI0003FE035E|nr:NYN domain-containing protein [Desulfatirhabdium butyrativorans]